MEKYVRYTTENFIERAKKIHGDKYDYSKVNCTNSYTKVCIICPKHGEFWQRPDKHLRGIGCPKCGLESMRKTLTKILILLLTNIITYVKKTITICILDSAAGSAVGIAGTE